MACIHDYPNSISTQDICLISTNVIQVISYHIHIYPNQLSINKTFNKDIRNISLDIQGSPSRLEAAAMPWWAKPAKLPVGRSCTLAHGSKNSMTASRILNWDGYSLLVVNQHRSLPANGCRLRSRYAPSQGPISLAAPTQSPYRPRRQTPTSNLLQGVPVSWPQ